MKWNPLPALMGRIVHLQAMWRIWTLETLEKLPMFPIKAPEFAENESFWQKYLPLMVLSGRSEYEFSLVSAS